MKRNRKPYKTGMMPEGDYNFCSECGDAIFSMSPYYCYTDENPLENPYDSIFCSLDHFNKFDRRGD